MVSSLWCDRFSVSFVGIVVPALPVPVHASAAKQNETNQTKPKKNHAHTHAHTQNRGWQSLCAEMASELRFAMRCGSRQRPAAKARNSDAAVPCDRCSPRATRRRTRYCSTGHEETTYIPSIEIPRLNGVSPVPHDGLSTMAPLRILSFSSYHFLFLFRMVCLVSRMVRENYSCRARTHHAEKACSKYKWKKINLCFSRYEIIFAISISLYLLFRKF